MLDEIDNIYIGTAYCFLKQSHPEHKNGMRGAYVGVAATGNSLVEAITKIAGELQEIDLVLVGCDNIYDTRFLEDELSTYFEELVGLLDEFPVGYKHIDLHPLN